MVHEHRTNVNGRPTRYLDVGSGQPLILIHAFPFSADMWLPQLDRAPGGWRFIAPDLRGFGAGTLEDEAALSMDDYAADIRALMDRLTIKRAVIGGLSMGGYITFAVFRQSPDRFSGMVLADTRPQPDTPEGLRGRRALLALVRSEGVKAVAEDLLPKLLGETSRRERPSVVAEAHRLIAANQVGAMGSAIQALMTRPDSTPDLARIRCPALVIVGQEDSVTPSSDAETMHRAIAGSQLAVLPRAGHLSNLEAPDEFSTTLAGFLRRSF